MHVAQLLHCPAGVRRGAQVCHSGAAARVGVPQHLLVTARAGSSAANRWGSFSFGRRRRPRPILQTVNCRQFPPRFPPLYVMVPSAHGALCVYPVILKSSVPGPAQLGWLVSLGIGELINRGDVLAV